MTTYILHISIAGFPINTGFDSQMLAEAAQRRAITNGASSTWIETKITTPSASLRLAQARA